jgi:hypothetical protein
MTSKQMNTTAIDEIINASKIARNNLFSITYPDYDPEELVYSKEVTELVKRLNIDPEDWEPPYYAVYKIGDLFFCYNSSGHPGCNWGQWKKPKLWPSGYNFA